MYLQFYDFRDDAPCDAVTAEKAVADHFGVFVAEHLHGVSSSLQWDHCKVLTTCNDMSVQLYFDGADALQQRDELFSLLSDVLDASGLPYFPVSFQTDGAGRARRLDTNYDFELWLDGYVQPTEVTTTTSTPMQQSTTSTVLATLSTTTTSTTSSRIDNAASADGPSASENDDVTWIIIVCVVLLVIIIVVVIVVVLTRRKKRKKVSKVGVAPAESSKVAPRKRKGDDTVGNSKQSPPDNRYVRRQFTQQVGTAHLERIGASHRAAMPTLASTQDVAPSTSNVTVINTQNSRRRVLKQRSSRRGRKSRLIDDSDSDDNSGRDTTDGSAKAVANPVANGSVVVTEGVQQQQPTSDTDTNKATDSDGTIDKPATSANGGKNGATRVAPKCDVPVRAPSTKVEGEVLFVDEDSEDDEATMDEVSKSRRSRRPLRGLSTSDSDSGVGLKAKAVGVMSPSSSASTSADIKNLDALAPKNNDVAPEVPKPVEEVVEIDDLLSEPLHNDSDGLMAIKPARGGRRAGATKVGKAEMSNNNDNDATLAGASRRSRKHRQKQEEEEEEQTLDGIDDEGVSINSRKMAKMKSAPAIVLEHQEEKDDGVIEDAYAVLAESTKDHRGLQRADTANCAVVDDFLEAEDALNESKSETSNEAAAEIDAPTSNDVVREKSSRRRAGNVAGQAGEQSTGVDQEGSLAGVRRRNARVRPQAEDAPEDDRESSTVESNGQDRVRRSRGAKFHVADEVVDRESTDDVSDNVPQVATRSAGRLKSRSPSENKATAVVAEKKPEVNIAEEDAAPVAAVISRHDDDSEEHSAFAEAANARRARMQRHRSEGPSASRKVHQPGEGMEKTVRRIGRINRTLKSRNSEAAPAEEPVDADAANAAHEVADAVKVGRRRRDDERDTAEEPTPQPLFQRIDRSKLP